MNLENLAVMPDAIINTIIFDFTCGSERTAAGIRNEILHYKAYRFNSILSEILSKKMGPGSLWKINRLEIDLGNIRAEDIGTDYMLQQFEVLFSKNIDETSSSQRWESVPNVSVVSAAEDQMGIIRTLLLSGDLPWWVGKNNFRSLDQLVKSAISGNREELRIFLVAQKNNQELVRRIDSLFSPGTISLLNELVPGISHFSVPDPFGLRGKRIFAEAFSHLNFEKEGELSLKFMMIDRILENPGLNLVTAIEWLGILTNRELADLGMYIEDRHSGKIENLRQILQKLTVFQLEYLSHPVLFKTIDVQADQETDKEVKKKMAVYLTDQMESKNPRLTNELLSADGEDLRTLQKIFKKYKRDGFFKERLIELIIEHPYFLQYRLLSLLANISIESEDGQRATDVKDRRKMPVTSVIQGLKEAQADFRNAVGRLPKRQLLIFDELFSSGTTVTPAAKSVITGLLRRISDHSLQVISGLACLNKSEIENLLPLHDTNSTLSEDTIRTIVENSGLSLLAPYLTAFFKQLGFTEEGRFKTKSYAQRAAYLLEYIVSGRQRNYEYTMQLDKLLCGLKPGESLPRYKRLTRLEINEADDLIASIIKNWKALKSTSPKGFRSSFLQRRGILTEQQDGWTLQVEKKGYDLLLDSIPWSFNLVKLSWMDKPVRVEW